MNKLPAFSVFNNFTTTCWAKWDHTLLIEPMSGNNSTNLAPEDEDGPYPLAMIYTCCWACVNVLRMCERFAHVYKYHVGIMTAR